MRIPPKETAAVVIDIQERLYPHIFEHEKLNHNCQILSEGLNILNIPFILTEQYSKGLGKTIPSIIECISDYNPIEKLSFSCCGSDEFKNKLEQLGKRNIVILGIEAHVCVLQTVLDLLVLGYRPCVIEDCVSSRIHHDKVIAIERMRESGAIISSFESILFELCQTAGNEQFKAISNLVK
jgi:nicotinamidase-related amidase